MGCMHPRRRRRRQLLCLEARCARQRTGRTGQAVEFSVSHALMFRPVVLVLSSDSEEEVVAISSPLPTRRSRPLPTPAHGGSNQLSRVAHASASAVSEVLVHTRSPNVHSVGGPSQAPWIWVSGAANRTTCFCKTHTHIR